jgi:tRNA threonylcarbamoyl adenosine modification protein (Sua5/YciO/YrdC/YwlC family)
MERVEIAAWHVRPDRIAKLVRGLEQGRLIAMPTDTTWAICCDATQRAAVQRLEGLRQDHDTTRTQAPPMSLLCGSLAVIGTLALVDQPQFRLLKRLLPGPYTIVLPASREVPRQLQSKRKTVGVRMPDHPIASAVMEQFGRPLLAATARRSDGLLCTSAAEVEEEYARGVDLLVETDAIEPEPSTVLDYTGAEPLVIREGRGPVEPAWGQAGD